MKTRFRSRIPGLAATLLAVLLGAEAHAIECGDVIGPGESVVLDEHLRCDTGTALTVIGPAKVDLNRHAVRCNVDATEPQTGILVVGRGARVENSFVDFCEVGVHLTGDGGHRLRSVIASAGHVGVLVESDRNRVEHVAAVANDYLGFDVRGSRNRVRGGTALASPIGYRVLGFRNEVSSTHSVANGSGYRVVGGERITLRDNLAEANEDGGFLVAQGRRVSLLNNESRGNVEGDGFLLYSPGDGTRVRDNVAQGNGRAGIRVLTGGHEVVRNTSLGNGVLQDGDADLEDGDPTCADNRWRRNVFATTNASCID